MNKKLFLPNVTLIAMTGVLVKETLMAMEYSMRGVEFASSVLVTDKPVKNVPKGIEVAIIDPLDSIDRFNYETVYHLGHFVSTDFALLVHYDGFVVNPDMWRPEFLEYDYIGSPWPLPTPGDDTTYRDIHGNICRVGNSVSIRSKRLMDLPEKIDLPWTPEKGLYNEDGFICARNRHIFEEHGMKFAPLELAVYFGHETMIPEVAGIKPFVFHKWAGTNAEYPDFRKKNPVMDNIRKLHGKIHNALKR